MMMENSEKIVKKENHPKSIQNFSQTVTKSNISYHRTAIFLISLIIFIQILFCCIIKINISIIKTSNYRISKEIETKEIIHKVIDEKGNKMFTNLVAFEGNINNYTEILQSVSEYEMITEWMEIPSFKLVMCYKLTHNGRLIMNIVEDCSVHKGLLFLFETETNCRFGAYINSGFHEFSHIKDKNAFLFSLNKKKPYLIKKPEEAFVINDNGIKFGMDDLVIFDLKSKDSYSNFSHFYGEGEKEVRNELTCGEKSFHLKEIEIYKVFKK